MRLLHGLLVRVQLYRLCQRMHRRLLVLLRGRLLLLRRVGRLRHRLLRRRLLRVSRPGSMPAFISSPGARAPGLFVSAFPTLDTPKTQTRPVFRSGP